LRFFAFCPLPAIALAQARRAGLSRKQKENYPLRALRLCGENKSLLKVLARLPPALAANIVPLPERSFP
jgi:hypothetical protein